MIDTTKLSREISIHALRGEDDASELRVDTASVNISIHALRGEDDHKSRNNAVCKRHFNPRPPWGGRQQKHTNMQHCVCT